MILLPLPHIVDALSCLPVVADHVAGTGTWRVLMHVGPSHSCTELWRGCEQAKRRPNSVSWLPAPWSFAAFCRSDSGSHAGAGCS